MCRIGPLSSRGRQPVSQEPSHSLSGTEGAASRNHPMLAIHIKAELHDDTLIYSIHIFAERGALPPARLERCWFVFVVLMPVGSGDLFDFSYSERRQGLQRQSDESRSICLADNCDAVS